ncbi:MAG: FtsW/RodA/SpoVE family cell cycle protein [Bacilli bacterium]
MKSIKKYYLLFFIPLIILMIISFFNMQNAKVISPIYNMHLTKQIIWFVLGFFLLFLTYKLNLNKILQYSFLLYLFSLILLVLVLFIGKEINGARAWFSIGAFSFQPSELMKLSLSLFLSDVISKHKISCKKDEFKLIFKVLLIVLIPSILVFLEPDTGAIIFFLLIAIMLLLFSKISKWWFLLLLTIVTLFVISFYLLFNYNRDLLINIIGTSFFYRVERLLSFTTNSSYQLENALIVMGSSSFLGSGLNNISLYIPEAPTDFIFAFNIGNFGFLSGSIVLISYLLLDYFFIFLITKVKNKKIKLFIISFISIFVFQQVINISMNLGILPIIGIPLPFLSYGGSTIIIYFLYIGLIFNFLKQEDSFFF